VSVFNLFFIFIEATYNRNFCVFRSMSGVSGETAPTTPVKMEVDESSEEHPLLSLSPSKLTPRPSILRKRDFEG
jgi:hypothetical protein